MDLTLLPRPGDGDQEGLAQLSRRPKLSNFSVASLLASARRAPSPERREEKEEEEEEEEGREEEESEAESDVSVDSPGEEEATHHPRLISPPGAVSPPRGEEPGEEDAPHPRLAVPTPLLGGRAPFPGLPPGVHLPHGLGFPPGWPLLHQGIPNLFKSGALVWGFLRINIFVGIRVGSRNVKTQMLPSEPFQSIPVPYHGCNDKVPPPNSGSQVIK
jgi:hypothetical protein